MKKRLSLLVLAVIVAATSILFKNEYPVQKIAKEDSPVIIVQPDFLCSLISTDVFQSKIDKSVNS